MAQQFKVVCLTRLVFRIYVVRDVTELQIGIFFWIFEKLYDGIDCLGIHFYANVAR